MRGDPRNLKGKTMALDESSLTAEESKFFETGGESGIPTGESESGAADAVSSSDPGASGGEGEGRSASGAGDKQAGNTHVPLAALQEERNRRRAIDKELREAREKLANFEGRFAVLERVGKGGEPAQQPGAEGPPNPEDDIFGAVKAIQTRLDGQDKATKDAEAERERQTKFVRDYQADANQFKQTNPDYMEAYNFLLKSRAAELQAIGYDTPEALHNALTADEFGIAEMAMSRGKSPAEMIYALAKQRGYAAKSVGEKSEPSAAERLATIERGQAANKSLNNTGGSTGDADMTVERLLAMPMSEFETWVEKNPAKAKRLMGG
ncbi:hypothetical protein ACQR1H_03180 [Bradyrhizobium sp. HKCCYLRH2015]|uniref:hypothetical protein n=1 Tax=Bradyrhizobium sp. HKCCYLRH2015 TaxID=3420742 RepID=UPI003EC07AFC